MMEVPMQKLITIDGQLSRINLIEKRRDYLKNFPLLSQRVLISNPYSALSIQKVSSQSLKVQIK
jgi:hypothetical protein